MSIALPFTSTDCFTQLNVAIVFLLKKKIDSSRGILDSSRGSIYVYM